MHRTKILISIPLVIFLISLTQTAIVSQRQGNMPGYGVLLSGWGGLLLLNPAWFANILGVGAYITLTDKGWGTGRFKRAAIFATSALALGLFSFLLPSIPNEQMTDPVVRLGLGFYLWELSFLTLALVCFNEWRILAALNSDKKFRE